MKELNKPIEMAAVVVGISLLLLAIVAIITKDDDSDAPILIKFKNAINHARLNNDVEGIMVVRVYNLDNPANAIFPLRKGVCGYQVELMQRFMNRFCSTRINEDGVWGKKTEQALWRYYTNQNRYMAPVMNKFWSYIGNGFQMSSDQWLDMFNKYKEELL